MSFYCQAEAVYRDFVYRTYTTVDAQLADLLQAMFWDGYDQESDGVYRALRQVRDTLNETVTYTKAPQAAPEGEDPILWFLTQSRQGNDVLYASAAVQALRAHGIPPTRPAKAMAPFFTASWGVMFSSLPPLSSPVTPSAPVWSSSRAAVLRTVSGVPTICWRATVS
mgnify:CR=1 FL=1